MSLSEVLLIAVRGEKLNKRQVFWILGYFTSFKFPRFRHFTPFPDVPNIGDRQVHTRVHHFPIFKKNRQNKYRNF